MGEGYQQVKKVWIRETTSGVVAWLLLQDQQVDSERN
jgi:hypothetical protein